MRTLIAFLALFGLAGALAAQDLKSVEKSLTQALRESNRKGVESAASLLPIHPGLARYMREKRVWDAKWDSRIAK